MKKLTKTIALMLALLVVAAVFASCGKTDEPKNDDTQPVAPQSDEPVTDEPEDTDDPDDGPISGGWAAADLSVEDLAEEEKALFDKVMAELVGADHVAKSVIATQVVSGTNYAFLCLSTPVVPDAVSYWSIVTVYADLSGNVEITNIAEIDPSEIKTLDEAAEPMTGAWAATPKTQGISVSDSVDKALAENEGSKLVPVAVLGTQVVAGTNYRILAYGTSGEETEAGLYVVEVYEALDGSADITAINAFDIGTYTQPAATED